MLNFSKEAFWILGDEINFEFLKLDIRYTYLEYFYTFHFPTTSARCKKNKRQKYVRTMLRGSLWKVEECHLSITMENQTSHKAENKTQTIYLRIFLLCCVPTFLISRLNCVNGLALRLRSSLQHFWSLSKCSGVVKLQRVLEKYPVRNHYMLLREKNLWSY